MALLGGPRATFGADFSLMLKQYFLGTLLNAHALLFFSTQASEHDLLLALCELWGVYCLLIFLGSFLTHIAGQYLAENSRGTPC